MGPSARNLSRKGRVCGERKMRNNYQKGWWSGLEGEVYSLQRDQSLALYSRPKLNPEALGPMHAKDLD